jgi:hypothetical protein
MLDADGLHRIGLGHKVVLVPLTEDLA